VALRPKLANNNLLASMPFPPDKGNHAMLSTEQINDLHRLYWAERWPIRKIERHLHMGWHTIRKYLDAPAQGPAQRPRTSKLDPFKACIAEWLEKDTTVTGTVIQERGNEGVHMAADESFKALAVRELRVEHAAVGFDESKGVEFAFVAGVVEHAEVSPINLETLARGGLHADKRTIRFDLRTGFLQIVA
jgi:hypothetical protein